MQTSWKALASFVILTLLAVPASAAHNETVMNGIDFWHTPAFGGSFTDFAQEPIPAGFFCDGSRPFKGRIHWQGETIATSPAGALGNADTVLHRLDDAVFDENGHAVTRIQFKALSLVSTSPLVTHCGSFNARVHLFGEQRVTDMQIESLGEGQGYFRAPLALTVRLVFTPVQDPKAQPLEITGRNVEFPATLIRWASEKVGGTGSNGRGADGFVVVDTDGDGRPDLTLPGTSNFFPVRQETGAQAAPTLPCGGCPANCICHCNGTDLHCVVPPGPTGDVFCESIANSRLLCQATASGGTSPYTFAWGPPPLSGSGQSKIVPCAGSGTRTISVTVTDANGLNGYFSAPFMCSGGGGGGPFPLGTPGEAAD